MRAARANRFLLVLLCVIAACAPEPTPLPIASLTTPTAPPTPTPPPALIAIDPPLLSAIPIVELEAMRAVAALETAPADPAPTEWERWLQVSVGARSRWQLLPDRLTIALVIDTSRPPFSDPALAAIAARTFVLPGSMPIELGTQALSESALDLDSLRIELANQGYPDGVIVRAAVVDVPDAPAFVEGLARAGIDFNAPLLLYTHEEARAAFTAETLDLAIIGWTTPAAREAWRALPNIQIVEWLSIPIAYRTSTGAVIGFTPSGWPILESP